MINLETGKTAIELYDGEIIAVLEAIQFYITVLGDAVEDGVTIAERYSNLCDTIYRQWEEVK